MSPVKLLHLAALLLVTPAAFAQATTEPSPAQQPEPETAAATPQAALASTSAGDKKLCRLERELGSQRAKRVCYTREQLDANSEAARGGGGDPPPAP